MKTAIQDLKEDLNTPKIVSKKEMNEFFKMSFPYIELNCNTNDEYWKITYSFDQRENILKYWNDRGYFKFKNLLLIFEK